ncbi:MAG: hypothetical protein CL675_12650 [Bdellovibrionaceae bacterium]|nr:hypothetical protein [Pseudobdellovibrionaceae bacterium]
MKRAKATLEKQIKAPPKDLFSYQPRPLSLVALQESKNRHPRCKKVNPADKTWQILNRKSMTGARRGISCGFF